MDPARFIGALSRLWHRPASSAAPHLSLGRQGEAAAAACLRRAGFIILRRNFRPPRGGEIDLVCRDRETLVFVEVKARSSEDFGRPMDAVDARKRRRLIRAGFAWLRMLDMPDVAFRFDVVEVIVAGSDLHIHHIPNAFSLPKPFHY